MHTKLVSARTHGRYLIDVPEHSRGTLVGFHGYKENAAIQMDVLQRIAGSRAFGLISIQGLHRFYSKGGEVVANWMTKQDREHAIADNVDYVGRVLHAVADEVGITRPMIYVGFSQGVAMAVRAAAFVQRPCDGIIAVASDVPPDVVPVLGTLPPVLYARGKQDELYGGEQAAKDLHVLRSGGVRVTEYVFDGGHLWTPAMIEQSAQFLDELLSS
jgi:predicted esterase